jgi:SAM-dependent methyltransferase
MPPDSPAPIFDRPLIARHLTRRSAGRDDFVTRLVLADLDDRLRAIMRTFEKAVILSPDPAPLPVRGESANGGFDFTRVSTVLEAPGVAMTDPEMLDLPERDYDLIVSLFDLDVVDDVPGFLARARAHLKPDGLFMAAAIGGESLTELREAFLMADSELSGGAWTRVAPFIPLNEAAGLLQRAGLALPVSDVETHVVRYRSPLALMQEIRALGGSNPLAARPRRMATRQLLAAAAAAYENLAGDADGRVRATLQIIWMMGWAPHESQQKPLKRGSAKVSLADVLGKPAG